MSTNLEMEVVCDGLEFPEGPVSLSDGSVLVVEMMRQTLTRVDACGRKTIVAKLGGGPNGVAIGPDRCAYVANNGGAFSFTKTGDLVDAGMKPLSYEGGSIQRVCLASGEVTTLYTECRGRRLAGPNDLVFDQDGGLWFTDFGAPMNGGRLFGGLYYARIDGSSIEAVVEDMISPNGIGLSPDGRTVYAADSFLGRIWAFDLAAPGVLAEPPPYQPGRVIHNLPGMQWPDSMALEANGSLCVATVFSSGIYVFDETGPLEHVAVPDTFTTNICFGGPDMRTAWITASQTGRLYKCRWPRPGARLHFNA